nr:MAG TPA: hypothetical protein [Bacteriophage sp.]DAW77676.1 MAG TPA: hypothetical protein [Bacteriophage sp.]
MLIYKAFCAFLGVQVYPVGAACILVSFRAGDSFQQLNRHIMPILHNTIKSVLRLFYFIGL